ncbi:glycosyltransferase family 39 protein [Candidatus Parcubacteria bacterium]|nr:glycosyltransferase family 39 protein [Candidatus Parcubacteria bacterium]
MSLKPSQFYLRTVDRHTVFILAMLMVGVTLFSIFVLSHQSLRLDEAQSLWQSSHSLSGILRLVGGDVHVPLHHFILHFWEKLTGNSVATTRDLSLVFFILTIPMVYMLGNLTFSRSVALFSAILFAFSPFLNWYGSEIRMYSLLVFLTVLNQFFFVLMYKKRPVSSGIWIGYGLSAVLGIYTHYFFGFILVTQAIFYFIYSGLFPRGTLRNLIMVAFVIVVALAPWLYYVYHLQALANSQPHLDPPTTINLFNTFSQFIFGFQNDHINTLIISLWPISVLLAFLTLKKESLVLPDVTYFLMTALVPTAAAFVISVLWRPLFLSRYLIVAVPSLYLFISWVISQYPRVIAKMFKIGLVVVMGVMLIQQGFSAYTPVKENFKEATDYLNENAQPQDIVAISAPFTIYPIEYYYRGPAAVTTIPDWDRFDPGAIPAFSLSDLEAEINNMKDHHDRIWVLLSYDQGYQSDVEDYFDNHFKRLEQLEFSPGLSLSLYQLRYNISQK